MSLIAVDKIELSNPEGDNVGFTSDPSSNLLLSMRDNTGNKKLDLIFNGETDFHFHDAENGASFSLVKEVGNPEPSGIEGISKRLIIMSDTNSFWVLVPAP